ncbi:MAG: hypothetical protein WCQ50_17135 [Spirochaetota bacterium]
MALENGRDLEGRSDEDFRRSDKGDDSQDSLVADVAAMLAMLCSRKDGDSALLGLFNQLNAVDPEVLVPFSFQLGSIAFKGSFRLQWRGVLGLPLSMEGRFTVLPEGSIPEGGTFWGFSLAIRAGETLLLRIRPPRDGKLRDWIPLGSTLAASGCELMVIEADCEASVIPGVDADA